MLRRSITLFLAGSFLLATVVTSHASLALTLYPSSGTISGAPGETTGWGFTISNSSATDWIWLTNSVFVSAKNIIQSTDLPYAGADPLWGIYTDLSGNLPPIAPSTSNLYVPYVPAQSGGGAVAMDPATPYGDLASGLITFTWDVYSAKPVDEFGIPLGLTPADFGSVDVNASVTSTVPSTVPEPSTYLLLTMALGVVGYARKRMLSVLLPREKFLDERG